LLDESALEVVGVPAGTVGAAMDQPNGTPAPSTGCAWDGDPAVTVALYYGMDPLEILAVARQLSPGGVDVAGLGQDAYLTAGVLFVDSGSQAFAVSAGPTSSRESLVPLAQNVLANL
jgi:hypothetical protein